MSPFVFQKKSLQMRTEKSVVFYLHLLFNMSPRFVPCRLLDSQWWEGEWWIVSKVLWEEHGEIEADLWIFFFFPEVSSPAGLCLSGVLLLICLLKGGFACIVSSRGLQSFNTQECSFCVTALSLLWCSEPWWFSFLLAELWCVGGQLRSRARQPQLCWALAASSRDLLIWIAGSKLLFLFF